MDGKDKMKFSITKNNKAFTIIELIVVIGIIGVLVGVASPSLKGKLEDARVAAITTDIKALEFFADERLIDNGLPETWRKSGTLPLGKTYNKDGLVKGNKDMEEGVYRVINLEDIEGHGVRRKKGYFVTNDRGNVYYIKGEVNSKLGNEMINYKNFNFHYLWIDNVNIKFLKNYEMVILEPRNSNKQQDYLKELRDNGTDLYAYQSVMGVPDDNVELVNKLNDDDYLSIDGGLPIQPEFGYRYGDIRSPNYRKALLEMIEKDVISQGYDGVFFDTMDDVHQKIFKENVNPETGRKIEDELVEGYVKFLEEIKEKFPSLSIIQNRGFSVYLNGGSKYVDTMMFENLRVEDYENPNLKRWLFDVLSEEADKNNSIIMAISYEKPEENFRVAKELNWIYTYYNRANQENGFQTPEKIYNNKYILR